MGTNTQDKCPFCQQIPSTKFHTTLECEMTNRLWNDLQHHLLRIHPNPINNLEKCFGIHGNTPNVILRNYLTFLLRKCIADHESIAYYNKKGLTNELLY